MKKYRLQIKNFGAVSWKMYDKNEYCENDAVKIVAHLQLVDPVHCYRKVRIA